MIKVSVIVPVYKVPLEYLRTCFDSLVAQTMQECEFIVVSDGAPEAECSICEEYASKDSRFKFFKREHAGVSATRNYGIDQAQGEYITFVDSDDWISEDALQKFVDLIKLTNAEIGIANAKRVGDKINEQIIFRFSDHIEKASLKNIPHMAVWGGIYNNSIIKNNQIRFQEQLKFSEDRIFNFEYYLQCKKIAFTNDVVYFYRQHETSVCKSKHTHEHVIQQCNAAKLLCKILAKSSEFSRNNISHQGRLLARMGMVSYINSGTTQEGIRQIKKYFLSNISSSQSVFYYCWYRAKVAALIGRLLHL